MTKLQPFELFQRDFIPRLRDLKKRYLVAQTYYRIQDPMVNDLKTPILVTEYDNLGMANIHKNAIKTDKYRAIFDLEKEAHRNKLVEMMNYNSKYAVYWSVVKQTSATKKLLEHDYVDRIRNYVKSNTNWRVEHHNGLRTSMEVTFGELFVTIKFGSQQIRVKFEEIEKT